MSERISKLVSFGLLCLTLLPCAGAKEAAQSANPAYNSGVSLYNQKNYRAAAVQFEAAMKAAPNNPDAIYYCALCSQLSNNRPRAKQLFEYITQRFPQSRVASLAQSALGQLSSSGSGGSRSSSGGESSGGTSAGVSSYAGGGASGGGSGDTDLSGVPDLVRVPFEKHGNDVTVMMQVNGRSVPFILDTGAFSVSVGQNHLKEWGIPSTQPKDTIDIGGVGDGKAKGWTQKLDLRLGQISQKNFPVNVMDNMQAPPLLGQNFLKAFNVSIDDSSRMVLLAKKGALAAKDITRKSYTGIEVPFNRGPGGHMMVNTVINGKPLVMMFDTGCEVTSFCASDWKKLGFTIPSSAVQGTSRGVLGDTTSYGFNLDSLKLRGTSTNIEQQSTPVSVTEGSTASLLGMSFYGKYKYAIDSNRNVIIFEGVER